MINILIVDDDTPAVAGISSAIDTEKLGVENIFSAYSVAQAQKILETETIHVVICDIEMPGENGLDLMEWIKSRGILPVTILLTSHADFHYAQRAIALGGLEYLLKPVVPSELETALNKAILEVEERRMAAMQGKDSLLWHNNRIVVVEQYIMDVLSENIPPDETTIIAEAKKRSIEISANRQHLIILITSKWPAPIEAMKSNLLLSNIVKKEVLEIFQPAYTVLLFFKIKHEQDRFLLLLQINSSSSDNPLLESLCNSLIQAFQRETQRDLCCYLSHPCSVAGLSREYRQLLLSDDNNVIYDKGVFYAWSNHNIICPPFSFDSVEALLQQKKVQKVQQMVDEYLDALAMSGNLDKSTLEHFREDFIQTVYIALKNNGIQAHLLFDDEESRILYQNSIVTVSHFKLWMEHLLQKSIAFMGMMDEGHSIVAKAVKYIEKNLEKPLSRNQVASYVCISPDHISRLFKKEMGVSFLQFLNDLKIRKAKEYLIKSDIPISDISQMLGIENFSYFSTIFKKATKMTPLDYRKKYQRYEGDKKNE